MDNLKDQFLYKPEFHRFADFLGVDKHLREDYSLSSKMLFLYEYGSKKANSDDFIDVLRAVTKMKKDLGNNTRGETLVKDMYRWARLDYDSLRLRDEKMIREEQLSEQEKRALERQDRILQKRKQWEQQRDKPKAMSQMAEQINLETLRDKQENQQKLSKQQSVADIKVKDAKPENIDPQEVEI